MDAHLNNEGKQKWGEVFPNGIIPVLTPFAKEAEIEETNQQFDVYMINWDMLTPVQRACIIQKLSKLFNTPEQEIEREILERGLPLQSKYVSSVSIPMRFLL